MRSTVDGIPQHHVLMQQPPFLELQPPAADFRFGAPLPGASEWSGEWDDELDDGLNPFYGNLEVKHRRRTTPEQLKVLEQWFEQNPRPDNATREHLAALLGITKRNVQVWFQNRRAKIKNQEKQREAANATFDSPTATPMLPRPPTAGPDAFSPRYAYTPHPALNGAPLVPDQAMGRRVSLAGGEAAAIDQWVRKRQVKQASLYGPTGPGIGQATAARRGSQPYPAPIVTRLDVAALDGPRTAIPTTGPSPKISPNGRMPSALHYAAMRNNTLRRASMPGVAQLISTTAFTPPRNNSANHPVRELSPIRDHDDAFLAPPSEFTPTYDFSPNAPLPNPEFSFGTAPAPPAPMSEVDPVSWNAFERGRLGSIASINSAHSVTTDGGTTEAGSVGDASWSLLLPAGFDPDIRRASAPAELLHNMGILGISPLPQYRPSPLAAYSQPVIDRGVPLTAPMATHYQGGPSPTSVASSSALSSEHASPLGTHASGMMPPPPVPSRSQSMYPAGLDPASFHPPGNADFLPYPAPTGEHYNRFGIDGLPSTQAAYLGDAANLQFLGSQDGTSGM
ncbi:hypothetical protein Q5752_004631 [Cryptotrichosporon argae]